MRLEFLIGRIGIGLGLMVSLAWLGPGLRAEEHWQDWSRVQALQPGQKIAVKRFKGMGPRVAGTYVSSDAGHLVVRKRNDQAVTLPKDHIRLVVRKRRVRHAVWIGAAAGFILMAGWTLGEGDFDQPRAALVVGGIGAGLGALGGLGVRAIGLGIAPVVYKAENQGPGASKTP